MSDHQITFIRDAQPYELGPADTAHKRGDTLSCGEATAIRWTRRGAARDSADIDNASALKSPLVGLSVDPPDSSVWVADAKSAALSRGYSEIDADAASSAVQKAMNRDTMNPELLLGVALRAAEESSKSRKQTQSGTAKAKPSMAGSSR